MQNSLNPTDPFSMSKTPVSRKHPVFCYHENKMGNLVKIYFSNLHVYDFRLHPYINTCISSDILEKWCKTLSKFITLSFCGFFYTFKSILTDATEGIQVINTSSSIVTRITKTLIHFNLTVMTWKKVEDSFH